MGTGARQIELGMLGAFATVARQWGATPLAGRIAESAGLAIEDSEIRLIYVLGARTTQLSPADVAAQLGVTRPALSKSLSRLRAANLIESAVSVEDRRSVYVSLTEAGRSAYVTLVGVGLDLVSAASDGLSQADLALIHGFLARFASGLGGPDPVEFPEHAR